MTLNLQQHHYRIYISLLLIQLYAYIYLSNISYCTYLMKFFIIFRDVIIIYFKQKLKV